MCYYTGGGTREKKWMDEKLFSLSTAKDLSVHCAKSGRQCISRLTPKRQFNPEWVFSNLGHVPSE